MFNRKMSLWISFWALEEKRWFFWYSKIGRHGQSQFSSGWWGKSMCDQVCVSERCMMHELEILNIKKTYFEPFDKCRSSSSSFRWEEHDTLHCYYIRKPSSKYKNTLPLPLLKKKLQKEMRWHFRSFCPPFPHFGIKFNTILSATLMADVQK